MRVLLVNATFVALIVSLTYLLTVYRDLFAGLSVFLALMIAFCLYVIFFNRIWYFMYGCSLAESLKKEEELLRRSGYSNRSDYSNQADYSNQDELVRQNEFKDYLT